MSSNNPFRTGNVGSYNVGFNNYNSFNGNPQMHASPGPGFWDNGSAESPFDTDPFFASAPRPNDNIQWSQPPPFQPPPNSYYPSAPQRQQTAPAAPTAWTYGQEQPSGHGTSSSSSRHSSSRSSRYSSSDRSTAPSTAASSHSGSQRSSSSSQRRSNTEPAGGWSGSQASDHSHRERTRRREDSGSTQSRSSSTRDRVDSQPQYQIGAIHANNGTNSNNNNIYGSGNTVGNGNGNTVNRQNYTTNHVNGTQYFNQNNGWP